jgi:hypothetical protein
VPPSQSDGFSHIDMGGGLVSQLSAANCDGGTVCCASFNAGMIACEPSGLCPGGGASGTYLVCSTDNDCPSRAPGACMALPIPVDAGISLSYCP